MPWAGAAKGVGAGWIVSICGWVEEGERGRTIGKLDVGQITESVGLLQLLVDTDGQVLSRDECRDRIGILCWSGEESGRRKSQDEADGGREDHFRVGGSRVLR